MAEVVRALWSNVTVAQFYNHYTPSYLDDFFILSDFMDKNNLLLASGDIPNSPDSSGSNHKPGGGPELPPGGRPPIQTIPAMMLGVGTKGRAFTEAAGQGLNHIDHPRRHYAGRPIILPNAFNWRTRVVPVAQFEATFGVELTAYADDKRPVRVLMSRQDTQLLKQQHHLDEYSMFHVDKGMIVELNTKQRERFNNHGV